MSCPSALSNTRDYAASDHPICRVPAVETQGQPRVRYSEYVMTRRDAAYIRRLPATLHGAAWCSPVQPDFGEKMRADVEMSHYKDRTNTCPFG